MSLCNTLQNTGQGDCIGKLGIADRFILFPRKKADGSAHSFANIAAVTKSALVALIEDTEPLDAIYVLPRVDNVEDERSESEVFEWESNKKTRIDDGIRSIIAYIEGADTEFLGRLESFEDNEWGYMYVDKYGNFTYNIDPDGVTVVPIATDGNSFKVTLIKPKYKEPGMIKLEFEVDTSVDDKYLRWQMLADLDFDGRTEDLYGLLTSKITEDTAPTVTQFVINLATDYGVAIEGAITADFTMTNVTDAGVVSVTATETVGTPGEYTLVYAAQDVGDILSIAFKKTLYAKKELTLTAIA